MINKAFIFCFIFGLLAIYAKAQNGETDEEKLPNIDEEEDGADFPAKNPKVRKPQKKALKKLYAEVFPVRRCNKWPKKFDWYKCCEDGMFGADGNLTQTYDACCRELGCCPICPCKYNGKFYNHNDVLQNKYMCKKFKCFYGTWKIISDVQCSECTVCNDPHFRTFDLQYHTLSFYDWHGKCRYALSQWFTGYIPPIGVFGDFYQCPNPYMGASCNRITDFKAWPSITIQYDHTGSPYDIKVNSGPIYTVASTSPALVTIGGITYPILAWKDGNCVYIQGPYGYMVKLCKNCVHIFAHPVLKNKIYGLCGIYNDNALDDFTSRSLNSYPIIMNPDPLFPLSWQTAASTQYNQSCPIKSFEPPQSHCDTDKELIEIFEVECRSKLGFARKDPQQWIHIERCVRDMCFCIPEERDRCLRDQVLLVKDYIN